ncbi:hypothetical protein H2198_007600 [Neophaeococcomyces mojaviensis]|uniref:Uncharacterized protein n=1 Tax=Neophaeococcomyces mojaviensis TaxID=3383035 RepID=A0ACC2ZZP9_9EURO|nr:hypothetical protein H2198_007600 [Knufia sp. JES_112]
MIKKHLAGAKTDSKEEDGLFREIVRLGTGEALVFCPTAVLSVPLGRPKLLQDSYAKVRIRDRLSADGGQSILPSHQFNDGGDNIAINVMEFRRYDSANLPAPGSLAGRGKGKGLQHNGSTSTNYTSVNDNTLKPSSASLTRSVSVGPSSSTSSTFGISEGNSVASTNPSAGHKRQRSAEVQQPVKQPKSTDPIAISEKAYPSKHEAVSIPQLEDFMYTVITDKMKEKRTHNWGIAGFIGTALELTSAKCGLPKHYLLSHDLVDRSKYKDGSDMMKAMFKKYYNDRGIAKNLRPDVPWVK